jgi:hypothetical protein
MSVLVLVLGLTLLAATSAVSPEECSSSRPVRVIANVVPALGQSPLWAATGGKPLAWEGPHTPVRVLWLRDIGVKGAAFLSGKARSGRAKVEFARSEYANREARYKLDDLGDKPKGVKDVDLQKYAFHWTLVWFPEPGCYEITARVGREQSTVYLEVAPAPKKST